MRERSGWLRGVSGASRRGGERGDRQAGREEVARRGGARGTQLLGEGEKTTEEEEQVGWAAAGLHSNGLTGR